MTRYLRLISEDPYESFGWFVGVSRYAMSETYKRAFEVYEESVALEDKRDYELQRLRASYEPFEMRLMGGWSADAFDLMLFSEEDLDGMHRLAVDKDYHANYLAGLPILFANNTIQRFGRRVLGRSLTWDDSFGNEYGAHRGPASYTSFVRAASNAIRHFGEWDDFDWNQFGPGVIYPPREKWTSRTRPMLESIEILQHAMGLGIHERFRDVVSMKVLIQIDGLIESQHDFDRFEARLFEAARDIAIAAGGDAPEKLEAQIAKLL